MNLKMKILHLKNYFRIYLNELKLFWKSNENLENKKITRNN